MRVFGLFVSLKGFFCRFLRYDTIRYDPIQSISSHFFLHLPTTKGAKFSIKFTNTFINTSFQASMRTIWHHKIIAWIFRNGHETNHLLILKRATFIYKRRIIIDNMLVIWYMYVVRDKLKFMYAIWTMVRKSQATAILNHLGFKQPNAHT